MKCALSSLRFCLIASFLISAVAQAETLRLTSHSFSDDAFPVLYTCDGQSISPSLSWSYAPANTKAFALTLADAEAGKDITYHWVVYNIPATLTNIDDNKPVANSQIGINSWSQKAYAPPCPIKGTAHTYVFTIYALDQVLGLPNNADLATTIATIKGHTIQKDDFTTIYTRWVA